MIHRTFKLVAACLVLHFNLLFNRPNAPLSRVVLKKQRIASPPHHTTPIVLASDGGEQANLEESPVLEPKRMYVAPFHLQFQLFISSLRCKQSAKVLYMAGRGSIVECVPFSPGGFLLYKFLQDQ